MLFVSIHIFKALNIFRFLKLSYSFLIMFSVNDDFVESTVLLLVLLLGDGNSSDTLFLQHFSRDALLSLIAT